MPALWLRGRTPYPFWMDALFLSIVALDLGGNVFDLYDGYPHFDLIPHGHGTGALTVLLAWLFGLQVQKAALLATAGHALLEGQELASDVLLGYRNVRGWWDTVGDLASVPLPGRWRELLNSDAEIYGGSGQGNFGGVSTEPVSFHGQDQSLVVTLPPLAVLVFAGSTD